MEKLDRRQARTKQLLYKALMELIEEKGSENVTVTDIANQADINRGTFYLHYRDVPDMLEQIKEEVFSKIVSFMVQLNPNDAIQYGNKDEAYPELVGIFEEIALHADFLKIMLGPKGDLSYAIKFKTTMAAHIFNKLNYSYPPEENSLVPRDYLIAYISSANFGMLCHWLESGMQKSPYEMGLIMTKIVTHGPIGVTSLKSK